MASAGGGRSDALATIDGLVLADLLRRDQIEDGMPPGHADRLEKFERKDREVLAALASAAYDARTEAGLAASLKRNPAEVKAVLQRAMALPEGAVHRVVRFGYNSRDGEPAYNLACRELTGWRTFTVAVPGLNRLWGVTIG